MKKEDQILIKLTKIEDKLDAHLNEHKITFDRLTKVYIPTFGILMPALSFFASWFHTNHHH